MSDKEKDFEDKLLKYSFLALLVMIAGSLIYNNSLWLQAWVNHPRQMAACTKNQTALGNCAHLVMEWGPALDFLEGVMEKTRD